MNKAFENIINKMDDEICLNPIYDYEKGYNRAMFDSINIVDEEQEEYNNGWIPCSERLPECGTKVLVQYGCGRINIEECKKNNDGIIGFYDGNYWSNADNYSAWQPLPEPFKER